MRGGNPRQLEPINLPKIGVSGNINLRPNDPNNIKVKKSAISSNTANVFFNQPKKQKNYCSTNLKDGIYKIKKPKITSESPGQIDEIVPERDNEDNDKEPVKNHESPGENKNNDSFINELEILLTNVNPKTQEDDVRSVDEDSTPDPHINFEHINDINKCRPQTSYGGINQRKHRLQMALNGANGQPKTKIKNVTQQNFMINPFEFGMQNDEY